MPFACSFFVLHSRAPAVKKKGTKEEYATEQPPSHHCSALKRLTKGHSMASSTERAPYPQTDAAAPKRDASVTSMLCRQQ
jgi:hypothetical protein